MSSIPLINTFTGNAAKNIRVVMTDIDDTLTDEGKLVPAAYEALWRLSDAGIDVIPVTGRPAGWCDCIIRQWPVSEIIGENGALAFWLEDGVRRELYHPEVSPETSRKKLRVLEQIILDKIQGARVSKDQFSRMFDLAIDFNEEPPYLGFETAEKIRSLCEANGAVAKVSSIHVNAWFGIYDKLSMARLFLSSRLGLNIETDNDKVIYFGDSPNDEPMFASFRYSCGVANIVQFLDRIQHVPAYITEDRGGRGFAEAVSVILGLR